MYISIITNVTIWLSEKIPIRLKKILYCEKKNNQEMHLCKQILFKNQQKFIKMVEEEELQKAVRDINSSRNL
jgi:hypothetical protein